MKNKALYGFESDGLGVGLSITQEILEKLDLDLHGAHPISGGKFLFLAFEGKGRPTAQEFKALLRGSPSLYLESPHEHLIHGLLHLQPDPDTESSGILVLESQSPLGLLATLDAHLKISGLGLYQLNLGLMGFSSAILTSQPFVNLESLGGVVCPPQVQRTFIDKISPKWRREYFI